MMTRRVGTTAVLLAALGTGCAARSQKPVGAIQAAELAPDERLGIDDVFEVRVFAEPDLSGPYRVAADGTVDYPFAGRIAVAGLKSGELQQLIAGRLKDGYINNPQVSVMVKEWNSRKVSVIGQVQKPGAVAYFPNMTIVEAVAAAGGFTPIAAKNSVSLRRELNGSVQSSNCPVADISEGRAPNVVLRPGDIVVVEERLF